MRAKTLKKLFKLIHSIKGFEDITSVEETIVDDERYINLFFEDEFFSVNVTGETEIGAISKVFELLKKIAS